MRLWSSNSMYLTERSIDYLWKKQEVSANNIVNSETPNFKGSYVTFQEEMRNRLERSRHSNSHELREKISSVSPRIHTTTNESNKLDGSNVDLVAENVELAKTGIEYQYAVRLISDEFTRLRSAMK